MLGGVSLGDLPLMLLCYGYVLSMILVSDRLPGVSRKASRKFLHAVIGNLVFAVPFFSGALSASLVAVPFVLVTFLASPYSPLPGVRAKLGRLSELTEEGHHLGPTLYSTSYSLLAILFSSRPHVMAAGVLPMAYGDSFAALVGEKYGRKRFANGKSVEGSVAMFLFSLLSILAGLIFFSSIYNYSPMEKILPALATSALVTVVEAISPRGLDNLGVPLLGSAVFLLLEVWL
jgi:dolichol kinase